MSVDVQSPPTDTFGNFRKPKSYGYASFSTLTTAAGFIGLVIGAVLAFTLNVLVAVAFTLVWFATLAVLTFKNSDNRSLAQRLGTRMAYRHAKRKGHVDYVSGPASQHGTFKLPGLLATTDLSEHTTTSLEPFGMIHFTKQRQFAVALACEPDGAALQDEQDIRNRIAAWAAFLEKLGIEQDLVQMQVSVETVPDSGSNLRHRIQRRMADSASELARTVMDKITESYPRTSASANSWVVLTYRANGRTPQEMADHLADRIPVLAASLAPSGAGVPLPVDALGFSQMALTAYNPELAQEIDQYGVDTVTGWDNVGPAAAHAAWNHYQHGTGISETYGMTEGPLSEVTSEVLAALLEPHQDIPRKRVTIVYQPKSPALSAALATKDVAATRARTNTTKNPSYRVTADHAAALHTAKEEARGATLVDFTLMATITVNDPAQLTKARAALHSAAPVSRIRLRLFTGSQDSAFAMTLPVGLVYGSIPMIPTGLREGF